tara:strand:+ start:6810 stop:7421 length:612 start_codon:yes stop_codon:yes gene_type:complete
MNENNEVLSFFDKDNEVLSFLDKDNNNIYIHLDNIMKSPVLSRILGLVSGFNDKPDMDDKGNYLYFNFLHGKSILLIFKCIGKQKDDILNDLSIRSFIFYMKKDLFIESCIYADYLCIDISYDLKDIIEKRPMNKEEDTYNEYQFMNYILDEYIEKEMNHRVFNSRYLEHGWQIVNQKIVGYNRTEQDIPRVYEYTLRKYINY